MKSIIVVDNIRRWPFVIPDVQVISSRDYLSNRKLSLESRLRVFNLCRSYRYQSLGYYVSLLAMARGHIPLPSISTIQDMRSASLSRLIAEELDPLIQKALRRHRMDRFTLTVYFGRNVAKAYDELSARIFRIFQTPMIRVKFRREDEEWLLDALGPVTASEIPEEHVPFVIESARQFFERDRMPASRKTTCRYNIAILTNEDEDTPPSNSKALKRFAAAAKKIKAEVEQISRTDYARLAEFDGLFIRETTSVDHHTYRFARRATAEGLVVIDDPESIIKCTNKVYLAELLDRHRIPTPDTQIVNRENRAAVADIISYPCIVKQPDSSFSLGVFKASSKDEFNALLDKLMEDSELLIVQEFVPTEFDWRIGVLDRQPLYSCKYHMVASHWQIAQKDAEETTYGNVEAVPIEQVPAIVVKQALRAANAIGSGLYGVDVKQVGDRVLVIEVNDNPSIDGEREDAVVGPALYDRIMQYFARNIDEKRGHQELES